MADNKKEQERVIRDDNILKAALVLGVLSVPPYLCIINSLTKSQQEITTVLFCLSILNSVLTTYVNSNIKGRGLLRSVQDALWALLCYSLGGILPFLIGSMIPNQTERIASLAALTALLIAFILFMDFDRKKRKNQQPKIWEFVVFWFTSVSVVSILALLNDVVKHFRSAPTKHAKPT